MMEKLKLGVAKNEYHWSLKVLINNIIKSWNATFPYDKLFFAGKKRDSNSRKNNNIIIKCTLHKEAVL
jgi:hypothetical protein